MLLFLSLGMALRGLALASLLYVGLIEHLQTIVQITSDVRVGTELLRIVVDSRVQSRCKKETEQGSGLATDLLLLPP
jgi:hypothetical protein